MLLLTKKSTLEHRFSSTDIILSYFKVCTSSYVGIKRTCGKLSTISRSDSPSIKYVSTFPLTIISLVILMVDPKTIILLPTCTWDIETKPTLSLTASSLEKHSPPPFKGVCQLFLLVLNVTNPSSRHRYQLC